MLGEVELAAAAGSCEAMRAAWSPLVRRSILVAGCVFQRRLRRHERRPAGAVPQPVAVIGSGDRRRRGRGRRRDPSPGCRRRQEADCRKLPLANTPKERPAGKARSLAAGPRFSAPRRPALRPYLASSHYGESGVDVEAHARGSNCASATAPQAARKWRAAAAVLADPSVTALDYVDLHAPGTASRSVALGIPLPPIP